MFKVIIIGGDGFDNYPLFEERCIACLKKKAKEGCGIMIYTTGEECNDKFAARFSIDIRYYLTDWKKHGNNALKIRNEEMLKDADAIICFEDDTKDTKIFLKQAVEYGKKCRYIDKTGAAKVY